MSYIAKFIFDSFNTLRIVANINEGTQKKIEKLLSIKQILTRMVSDARFLQQDFEGSSYDIKNSLLYIDTMAQNKLRKSRLEEAQKSHITFDDSYRPVEPQELHETKIEFATKALETVERVTSQLEEDLAYRPVQILGVTMTPELVNTFIAVLASSSLDIINKQLGI